MQKRSAAFQAWVANRFLRAPSEERREDPAEGGGEEEEARRGGKTRRDAERRGCQREAGGGSRCGGRGERDPEPRRASSLGRRAGSLRSRPRRSSFFFFLLPMGGRPVTPPPLVVVDRAETPTLAGARATRVGAETDLRVVFRCHGVVPACYYLAGAAAGVSRASNGGKPACERGGRGRAGRGGGAKRVWQGPATRRGRRAIDLVRIGSRTGRGRVRSVARASGVGSVPNRCSCSLSHALLFCGDRHLSHLSFLLVAWLLLVGLVAGSRNAWQAVCGKRPLRRPIMQSPIRYKVRLVDFLTAPVAASRASQAGGSLWSALDVSRGGGDGWGRSDGSEQSSPSSLAGKASPTHLGDRASSSHSPTAHGAKELYARGVDSSGKASPPLAAGGPGRAAWSSAVETRSPPSRRQREIQRSYQQQYQQALAGANLASEGRNAG